MSKPIHNRVMCPECFRQKMLFETQKQADNFIKWNGDDIDTNGGELRSYYCSACGGFHITSKPFKPSYMHATDKLIKRYEKDEILERAIKTDGNSVNVSDDIKDIVETLPDDIKSKNKLKSYLTRYMDEHGIKDDEKRLEIRTTIYEMIKLGQLNIKTQTSCDKILSDEDIFKLISDKRKTCIQQFLNGINAVIVMHKLVISKEQRKRLIKLWFEDYKEKNKDIGSVINGILKMMPQLEKARKHFINDLVKSYVKVSKKEIPDDKIQNIKDLLHYYYTHINIFN